MPRLSRRPAPRVRAFTLVEVLLALALLSLLLVALSQFLLSMGELWGRNRRQRLFDQHARAVTRHVGDMLQRAALAPVADGGVRIATDRGPLAPDEPRLAFDLAAGDRLLAWPGAPLPDVQCALVAPPGRGLVLLWQSRWELDFGKVAPRACVVSPLVTRLGYDYFHADTGTWETRPAPVADRGGETALPARLRLHFESDGWSADTLVPVPRPAPGLPVL